MGEFLNLVVKPEVTGRLSWLLEKDELQVNQDLKLTWQVRGEEVRNDIRSKLKQLPSQTNLIEVFEGEEVARRLLILGEPGAGKTTSLLKLARELITQAEQNPTAPIPVIFELSAWKNDSKSIEAWLAEQLKDNYGIEVKISQKWLKQNKILPLLDGLDELGLTRQRLAIEKINQYLHEDLARQIVVCCRWEEYKQGEIQLYRLRGAYYLQPPTETDIKDYLQLLNQQDLWQKIATNDLMRELAQKPLFLNLMMVAFQGEAIVSESQLFKEYIEEQLKRPLNLQKYPQGKPPYSDEDTKKWLTYLAGQLEADSLTVFLIEKMQPYWIDSERERWLFQWICTMILVLIYGVIYGLGFLLNFESNYVLSIALIYGVITAQYFLAFKEYQINLEAFKFNWQRVRKGLIHGLIYGLMCGLIYGLITWLIDGGILGLFSGLIYGIISELINNLKSEINNRINPNQGIKEVWKKTEIIFLLTSPFMMLIFPLAALFTGESFTGIQSVGSGLSLGLLFSLYIGGKDLIQHFTLRLILGQQGLIPRNYAHFLDYAADRKLIQRVGGQYRFLHDSLRKHFAALAPMPERIIE